VRNHRFNTLQNIVGTCSGVKTIEQAALHFAAEDHTSTNAGFSFIFRTNNPGENKEVRSRVASAIRIHNAAYASQIIGLQPYAAAYLPATGITKKERD
jgi:hypothetical protein